MCTNSPGDGGDKSDAPKQSRMSPPRRERRGLLPGVGVSVGLNKRQREFPAPPWAGVKRVRSAAQSTYSIYKWYEANATGLDPVDEADTW